MNITVFVCLLCRSFPPDFPALLAVDVCRYSCNVVCVKGLMLSVLGTLCLVLALWCWGCATAPGVSAGVTVGAAMTNSVPLLSAASGAAAVIPGGQPVSVALGGIAALLSALGGFLVRHYLSPGPVVIPTAPKSESNTPKT